MKVLVTGASGFVGRFVVRELVRLKAEVFALSRRRPDPVVCAGANWVPCDLLDATSAERALGKIKPDIVVHLAWCVEHGAFWTSPLNADWVAATARLARAATRSGTRRFISAGTCYEYDWPSDSDCDDATTPIKPSTLYAVSKDATRRELEVLFAGTNVSFAWARLFFLYGPGEDSRRLVPSIARALVKGGTAPCSRGLAVRDFMDVRDAGAALARLALSDASGAFNVASGKAVSVADIVNTLGRLAGRQDLVQLGAIPDRPGEPPRITAAVARLKTIEGVAEPVKLELGLADTLRYWAANMAEETTR
jgi:nucleoside-diphosphate-sugar epimerase